MPARSRARRLTASGSRSGSTATLSTTLLGTMIESSPVSERRVQQAQRADRPLDLPGQRPALQAHPLADPERPRAEQHRARDQVAQRLLRRQAEDHRGESAARAPASGLRSRPRCSATSSVTDERRQADQEADRSRRRRVQAPEQRRPERPPDVARDRPAEDQQHDHGDDRSGVFAFERACRGGRACRVLAEQAHAVVVEDDDPHEQRHQHQRLQARALDCRGLTWCSSPTSFQAWLRVSNIFGGVLRRCGIGSPMMAIPQRCAPPACRDRPAGLDIRIAPRRASGSMRPAYRPP